MHAKTEVTVDDWFALEETRYGDEVLVVSLAGELDGAGVATARRHLKAALDGPCTFVVLDLTELEFLDAAAVALLYRLAARPDGAALRLLPSRHGAVNRILALTEVRSVVQIVA